MAGCGKGGAVVMAGGGDSGAGTQAARQQIRSKGGLGTPFSACGGAAARGQGSSGGGDGRQGGGSGPRRGRAQQAKKRATFPLINSKIIVAADTGDLMLLVSTVQAHLPQMNLVNLSTAFHRIAKLAAGDPAAQAALRQHLLLPAMVVSVRGALERAEANGAPPQCQAISNITWALATVQFVDMPLLIMAADSARRHVNSFKPFELSATLWAYAKFGGLDPAAIECAALLFAAASQHIAAHAADFSFRCLVMVAYAYAAAQQPDEALFARLGEQMLPQLHTASCQELEHTVWAFSSVVDALGRHKRFFTELARRCTLKLSEFKPQELCSLMWSFAAAGHDAEELFDNAVLTLKFVDLQCHQLASLLAALARIRPRSQVAQATLLLMLPTCTRQLESLKPVELVAVAWAAARVFGEARGSGGGTDEEPLPVAVTEFFKAASPWILARLHEYSGLQLALLAASFLALRLGGSSELFPVLGCAVLRQSRVLDTPALMLLLRCLPAVPLNGCTGAACVLFTEVSQRLDGLHARQLQELSQICSRLLNLNRSTLSREELQSCCNVLAQAGPMSMAQAKTSQEDIAYVLAAGPPWLQQQAGVPAQQPSFRADDATAATSSSAVAAIAANVSSTMVVGSSGTAGAATAPGVIGSRLPVSAWQAYTQQSSPEETSDRGALPPLPTVPISIKNTFVEVGAGEEDEDDSQSKPLPPPLDIIPPSVSEEKLAAYRMDYQNFRAGKAVGAKGELTDKVALELDLALPQSMSSQAQQSESTVRAMDAGPPGIVGAEQGPISFPLTKPTDFAFAEPAMLSMASSQTPPKAGIAEFQPHASKVSVKNTFLHIPDQSDSEGDSDDDEPARVLPPPLPFISEVSEEKLAAYRQDYQNFRAGKSHGAKGEVVSSVALDLAADDTAILNAQRHADHSGEMGKKKSDDRKASRRKKQNDLVADQPAFVQLPAPAQQSGTRGSLAGF